MYADAVMKVILKTQDLDASSISVPVVTNVVFDKMHFKVSIIPLDPPLQSLLYRLLSFLFLSFFTYLQFSISFVSFDDNFFAVNE